MNDHEQEQRMEQRQAEDEADLASAFEKHLGTQEELEQYARQKVQDEADLVLGRLLRNTLIEQQQETIREYQRTERALRERLEQAEEDAELGRLIRQMPAYCYLWRAGECWLFGDAEKNSQAETPEEALKAAGIGKKKEDA